MMRLVETQDRRSYPRFDTELDLVISTGLRRVKCATINISIGGTRIAWRDILESVEDTLVVGQFIDLEVANHVAVQGFVVRIDEGLLSVAFDIADDELPLVTERMSEAAGLDIRAA